MPPRHIGSAILLRSALTCAVASLSSTGLVHAQITLTLTPSDYNGYNIGCFGGADGAIDLSVSGGTPPYSYDWSTGATTQDVTELRSGYISVVVRDSQNGQGREELTLTEPNDLQTDAVPYQYASGFNISCVSCYNGSIAVTTTEGVPPYSYDWGDGTTTEDRAQLDAGTYQVLITDANGCILKSPALFLTQPERDDWSKGGNAGTDPATQFIGTTDNKDVVFKSDGAERLRLLSSGGARLTSLSFANGHQLLVSDSTGELRRLTDGDYTDYVDPCEHGSGLPWTTCGNYVSEYARLGTRNAVALWLITNNVPRIIVTSMGKVGIGTQPPTGAVDQYRLYVDDGIVARDVLVQHGPGPDFVFDPGYALRTLAELRAYVDQHAHLPGIPTACELETQGGVSLGDIARELTRTAEEQALYILQLEEKLGRMEQRIEILEASQH